MLKINQGTTLSVPVPHSPMPDYNHELVLIGAGKYTLSLFCAGSVLLAEANAATTAGFVPGVYRYQVIASRDDERHVIGAGSAQVHADFSQLPAGYDFRSHAEKMLAAINDVLQGRIPKDMQAYEIDGRQLTRIPILELEKMRRSYQATVNRERRKAAGKPAFAPRTVKVRFNR